MNVHPLSKALAALGWTQGELSRRSGVAQSTISFVLGGRRGGKFSAASARKIVEAIEKERRVRRFPDRQKVDIVVACRLDSLIFAPKTLARRVA